MGKIWRMLRPNPPKPQARFLSIRPPSDMTETDSAITALPIRAVSPQPVRFSFRTAVCLSTAPPITRVASLPRCLEQRPQRHAPLWRPHGRVRVSVGRTGHLAEPRGQSALDLLLGIVALCPPTAARADSVGTASRLARDNCSNQ